MSRSLEIKLVDKSTERISYVLGEDEKGKYIRFTTGYPGYQGRVRLKDFDL